jgi:hypothetical protein
VTRRSSVVRRVRTGRHVLQQIGDRTEAPLLGERDLAVAAT